MINFLACAYGNGQCGNMPDTGSHHVLMIAACGAGLVALGFVPKLRDVLARRRTAA